MNEGEAEQDLSLFSDDFKGHEYATRASCRNGTHVLIIHNVCPFFFFFYLIKETAGSTLLVKTFFKLLINQ